MWLRPREFVRGGFSNRQREPASFAEIADSATALRAGGTEVFDKRFAFAYHERRPEAWAALRDDLRVAAWTVTAAAFDRFTSLRQPVVSMSWAEMRRRAGTAAAESWPGRQQDAPTSAAPRSSPIVVAGFAR